MTLNSPLQWWRPLLWGQWHVRDKKWLWTPERGPVHGHRITLQVWSFHFKALGKITRQKKTHISCNMCNYRTPNSFSADTQAAVPELRHQHHKKTLEIFALSSLYCFMTRPLQKTALHCFALRSNQFAFSSNCKKVLGMNTRRHYFFFPQCAAKWIGNHEESCV